ncbi:MAG: LysM peptidoglycan-binding domain-containing protein [Verrucomicrobiota bacterium]
MARFKFLLAFLAFLVCAAGMIGAYYYWEKFARPQISVNRHFEGGEGKKEKPDLGKRHYDEAIRLLEEGELVSGRDRLLYLMEYYPESATFAEAKRVAGEVNLDLLISPIPQPRKGTHEVRRGEALVTIARRHNTTIDFMMRANGKTTSLIYPDEELIVFPLDFRVEISLVDGTLTVYDGDEFFKEYTILETNLPPEVRPPVSTSVSEKVAWDIDRPVNFTDVNYLDCSKWARTAKIGLFIREKSENSLEGSSAPFGVMVAKTDMEELFTILRVGSEVRLVN